MENILIVGAHPDDIELGCIGSLMKLKKEGKKIGPNNLMIASIARAHNAVLVTHNMREFKRVPGIELEDWAEVVF